MEINHLKKIIRKWPAYEKFLENSGVNPLKIKKISDLPIVDKQFISSAIHSLPLYKVKNIIPSSGSTGESFSFGLFGDGDLKRTSNLIDSVLKNRFNTGHKKTLLLNMMPGAISIPSSTVSVASIGVRTDTAISVIKSFGSSFDQLILVGEPLFLKNLIEYGVKESISWKYVPLYIIVGGEWIPESYGKYIETFVGPQRVISSMGMAELGLSYFYETNETIILRHLLSKDREVFKRHFGDLDFCPMIFSYDEKEVYVESVIETDSDLGSILLSTVNPDRTLPLIRYKSGDKGEILSGEQINSVLKDLGHIPLISSSDTKFLAHFGRGKKTSNIYPEQIKEIIFDNWEIAATTTGNFKLCISRGAVHLAVQLKQGIIPDYVWEEKYRDAFDGLHLKIKLYSFKQFPHVLDFERKVRYVCESDSCCESRREAESLSSAV